MSLPLHRHFLVLLCSAAVGYACWKFCPGGLLDRVWFENVALGFSNPPLLISGNGTHEKPWALRTVSAEAKANARNAPVLVTLDDDPGNVFQSSPHSPVDVAVILKNLQRLGQRKASIAAVLAWENSDPVSLAALDQVLGGFEGLVTAAPLTRGAVAAPMPPSFRRASIPISSVKGDVSQLPVVNRLALPGLVLGGDRALSGFTVLGTEPESDQPQLVAQWEDRVVFSLPVLAVLQRNGLPVEGIQVTPGVSLKLGPRGPMVPIDPFGRLSALLKRVNAAVEIPAESVIDGGTELFAGKSQLVIVRDDRSAAEPQSRAFSKNLVTVVTAIASEAGMAVTVRYRRVPAQVELALLGAWLMVCAYLAGSTEILRKIGFSALILIAISAQWAAFGLGETWLPGMAMVATASTAFVFSITRKMAIPLAIAVPERIPIIEEPTPIEQTPACNKQPSLRKAASKKRSRSKKQPPPST